MIKVFTDFNAMTRDDTCWLMAYQDTDLSQQIETLQLKKGDKIVLYQDEDDFEVTATIDYRYVAILSREAWIAAPDWNTLVRK